MNSSRWRLVIVLNIFLLFAILLVFEVEFTAYSTAFCTSCHEMKSQELGWQESTHSKIQCIGCHRLGLWQKGGMVWAHFGRKSVSGLSSAVVCLQCHKEERIVTPSGDLKIPHRNHLDLTECRRCHPATGHAKESESGGQEVIVMGVCLKCHYKKAETLGCRGCHQHPPMTPAHLTEDWSQYHGGAARENLTACNSCHGYTLFLNSEIKHTAEQALTSPANYARDNEFCSQCHRRRPASHTFYFLYKHPRSALDNEDRCLVCHSWNFPLPTQNSADLFCQKCHFFRGWVPVPWGRESEEALKRLEVEMGK